MTPLFNRRPRGHLYEYIMSDKIKMRDGDAMLIMVKGGEVIHFNPNMSLPHSEFVKRTTGQLPAGAGSAQYQSSTAKSQPSVQSTSSDTNSPLRRKSRMQSRGPSNELW